MSKFDEAMKRMDERFGHDNLISVATIDGEWPAVRTVNGFYEDGAFYVVTYALSGKMKQMETNGNAAIAGEWFTARGQGESLGWIRAEANQEMASKLRAAFAEWYDNGHTDETDPHTIILRIKLTTATLFHQGTKYDIDFTCGKA